MIQTGPMPVIIFSEDKMSATIDPGNSRDPVSLDMLTRLVNEAGVSFGIDKEQLRQISKSGFPSEEPILIARGANPVNGEDSIVIFCFRLLMVRPGGSAKTPVFWGESHFGNNKISRKNEILAVKLRFTAGGSGQNVLGQVVAAKPGNDVRFEPGKNVQTRYYPDKIEYSAMCEGVVRVGENSIEVNSQAVIEHDIDLSTGNIEFAGSLLIAGDVCRGFSVVSQGDVKIEGNVDGGKVSAEGDIIVLGSVLRSSELHAGGTIKAKHIEYSEVDCAQNIEVEDGIMHSEIICSGRVKLISGRGILVGGTVKAKEGVEAKIVGTPMSTLTLIHIGGEFFGSRQVVRLESELGAIEQEIMRIQGTLKPFLKKDLGSVAIPADKKWALRSLANRLKDLKQRRTLIKEKLVVSDQLSHRKPSSIQQLQVHHTVYRGVTIMFGIKQFEVHDELNHVAIFEAMNSGEIVVTSLADR